MNAHIETTAGRIAATAILAVFAWVLLRPAPPVDVSVAVNAPRVESEVVRN